LWLVVSHRTVLDLHVHLRDLPGVDRDLIGDYPHFKTGVAPLQVAGPGSPPPVPALPPFPTRWHRQMPGLALRKSAAGRIMGAGL
jgi:hypothetical protein